MQGEIRIFEFNVNSYAPKVNKNLGINSTYAQTNNFTQNGIGLFSKSGGNQYLLAKTFFMLLDLTPESKRNLRRIEIYYTSNI